MRSMVRRMNWNDGPSFRRIMKNGLGGGQLPIERWLQVQQKVDVWHEDR